MGNDSKELKGRIDFLYVFDVQDGNPNGDPDAGNLPRIDVETGKGIVTDVCIKRKIRNYVQIAKDKVPGYDIFIREKGVLNNLIDGAYESDEVKNAKKGADQVEAARKQMCKTYYDVRTFGAVMSTGKNAGQVKGPVQITFSRSVDPIFVSEHSITRMAVATEKEQEKQGGDNRTMGRKATVPYGLYVAHGFISPSFADRTGFNNDDLELLFSALCNMFDQDRSASRGMMAAKKLIVFQHESKLGNAAADSLFNLIKIEKNVECAPRSFADYTISIDRSCLPNGVTVREII